MHDSHAMEALDRARLDAGVFAEMLLGVGLWAHQLEVVASPSRYRVICAGRQVGKSRLLREYRSCERSHCGCDSVTAPFVATPAHNAVPAI